MKILLVHPTFDIYGGAELAIVKLVEYLHSVGDEVHIVTNIMNYKLRKHLENNCKICVVFGNDIYSEMASYVQKHYQEYDVVHMHNHPSELTLYPIKYPSVWFVNEPESSLQDNRLDPKEYTMVNESISKIITNSEFNQEWIFSLYDIRSEIVRYGVDSEYWNKGNPNNPSIKNMDIKDYEFVACHSGWWNEYKNQVESINIFTKFTKQVPNSKLILIGNNNTPYASKVRQSILDSGIEDKIIIVGMVDKSLVRDVYTRADVFINPCKLQGSFLSTYEAISMGKPVIVTKNLPDIKLVKEHDLCIVSDDFYQSLLDLYLGNTKVNLAAKDWVRNNLTWENYGKGIRKVLEGVIG